MPAWSETKPRLRMVTPPIHSLVVIQLARLGDFLQSTPLLAALRARHPGARIMAVVGPAQAPLACNCGLVDEILPLDPVALADAAADRHSRRALARLRALCEPIWSQPAQAVYNLNFSSLAAGVAAGWDRADQHGWRLEEDRRRLVGAAWSSFVMQNVSDRRLTRLHLCDILASYAAPETPPLARLAQRVDEGAAARVQELLGPRRPRVALQLGANSDLRRWPVASFAALAKALLERGIEVFLVGGHVERPLGQRLKEALGPAGEKVRDLMGRTDLPGLAAALAAMDLVVSGDTGSLHLATAVGAPVLALFMGPAQVHETGPYGAGHLVLQARDACGPCQEQAPVCGGVAPCRRLLEPAAVIQAAIELLDGRPAAEVGAGLDLPEGVEPLLGVMDGFGQRYRPLRPRSLDPLTALALALRQAGRDLLRPGPAAGDLAELADEHRPPRPEARPVLAGL
ncbi:MAG: glycosyltransferase family 9 protein, partial [Desulfarculus sp.]|nr:glycosyltransferase family 9 protein [Desulfarculus sp.]